MRRRRITPPPEPSAPSIVPIVPTASLRLGLIPGAVVGLLAGLFLGPALTLIFRLFELHDETFVLERLGGHMAAASLGCALLFAPLGTWMARANEVLTLCTACLLLPAYAFLHTGGLAMIQLNSKVSFFAEWEALQSYDQALGLSVRVAAMAAFPFPLPFGTPCLICFLLVLFWARRRLRGVALMNHPLLEAAVR